MVRLFTNMMCGLITTLAGPLMAQESREPWTPRPDMVKKFEARRGDFNYDETKVPQYNLPDALLSADGNRITSQASWTNLRRPELLQQFRDHVYGNRPDIKYSVKYETVEEMDDAFNGTAIGRSMKAVVAMGDRTYSYPFVIFLPKQSKKPVPAVIHINNRYFIPLEKAVSEIDPFWPAKTLIERGYATASFHTSDVDPDQKDGYEQGIRAFFANGKQPADRDWRSLSAWGWGASRVLDHLETIDAIDARQVAVVGHSRGGKASLWTAAEDTRFAVAYSNNSGCGGAALSRRSYGETVSRITGNFPHWFCAPFAAYAGRENELPVDQHQLIGLIAPRGVYVASADEDLWADPRGEYLSVIESASVFRLLGKESIANPEMPALNSPRIVGQAGYHIRTGGHGLESQDWEWFLDFTDRQFK